jgi:hypothetical protein
MRNSSNKEAKMNLERINSENFYKNPDRYQLVSGRIKGAPTCPYGNHYQWIGYDKLENKFVRFTKSIFKKLISTQTPSV